jgi:hypothetical protein
MPKFQETLQKVVKEVSEHKSHLTLHQLNERLQTYSGDETEKIMEAEETIKVLKNFEIVLLPSYGLVSQSIIDEIREYMIKAKRTPLDTLKEEFPDYKDALIAICQNINCSVKWKSIDQVEIILP